MAAIEVKVLRLPHGEGLASPERRTEHAAGFDIQRRLILIRISR